MRSWTELKILPLNRFRILQGLSYKKFLTLYQKGTVRDYHRMFVLLDAPLMDMSKLVMESNFINGLKPEIRVEVQMIKQQGLLN